MKRIFYQKLAIFIFIFFLGLNWIELKAAHVDNSEFSSLENVKIIFVPNDFNCFESFDPEYIAKQGYESGWVDFSDQDYLVFSQEKIDSATAKRGVAFYTNQVGEYKSKIPLDCSGRVFASSQEISSNGRSLLLSCNVYYYSLSSQPELDSDGFFLGGIWNWLTSFLYKPFDFIFKGGSDSFSDIDFAYKIAKYDLRDLKIIPPVKSCSFLDSPYASLLTLAKSDLLANLTLEERRSIEQQGLSNYSSKLKFSLDHFKENNRCLNDYLANFTFNSRFFDYFIRLQGPVLEEIYKNSKDQSLFSSYPCGDLIFINPANYAEDEVNSIILEKIKRILVLEQRPVGAFIYWPSNLSNLYNPTTKSYFGSSSKKPNQAVSIIGYDDTFRADNFLDKPSEAGAFIVQNNLGTTWGDQGYFYISYQDQSLKLGSFYSFSKKIVSKKDLKEVRVPLGDFTYSFDQSGTVNLETVIYTEGISCPAVGFIVPYPDTTITLKGEILSPDQKKSSFQQIFYFTEAGFYRKKLKEELVFKNTLSSDEYQVNLKAIYQGNHISKFIKSLDRNYDKKIIIDDKFYGSSEYGLVYSKFNFFPYFSEKEDNYSLENFITPKVRSYGKVEINLEKNEMKVVPEVINSFSCLVNSLQISDIFSEICLANQKETKLICQSLGEKSRVRSNRETAIEDGYFLIFTQKGGEEFKIKITLFQDLDDNNIPDLVYSVGDFKDLTIELKKGWNLFSLTVVPEDENGYQNPELRRVSRILPESSAIYQYYKQDLSNHYKSSWERGARDQINAILSPGKGYWVYFEKDQEIFLYGRELLSYRAKLSKGWNLIGSVYGAEDIEISLPPELPLEDKVYLYDNKTNSYLKSNFLISSFGYWIFVEDDKFVFLLD